MVFIQVLLIAFFLFASSIKILGWAKVIFEPQLAFFIRYGLNRTVMFMVGVIEATGATAMLFGLVTSNSLVVSIGASLLLFTSVGAMFFHFRFDTWKDAIPSMVTLLLSGSVVLPLVDVLHGYWLG